MQNQASNTTAKRGGARPGAGPGRPVGYKTPSTVKRIAIRTLQDIMLDTSAPAEARVMAACKLVDHEW